MLSLTPHQDCDLAAESLRGLLTSFGVDYSSVGVGVTDRGAALFVFTLEASDVRERSGKVTRFRGFPVEWRPAPLARADALA